MHPKKATRPALFALGFLSIGTQVYLVRESMMVFSNNELVIGMVLATWMLLTGIGSHLGRFIPRLARRRGTLVILMLVAGMLPSPMVAGVDLLKVLLVPYGSTADLWQILAICLLVQLPFCLLNGFLFSALSTCSPGDSPAGSYALESLGSMVSGALVNFLLLWILGTFTGLWLITVLYLLLVAGFTRVSGGIKPALAVLFVSLAWISFLGATDPGAMTERLLYPGQQVISDAETPYGQVVVTQSEKQLNFFENGTLLCSSGNEIGNEEQVHYAMVQHPDPESVLLVSGGFSGTLDEILKYRPRRIDYVELDPSLIGIASKFTHQLGHPSVRVHETDARRYIRSTGSRYDVVLVNLPAPSTLQMNRYYSVEFLTEVKRKMKPGAVIAYSLPTGGEYVSEEAGLLNAVLWNTLKQCFTGVLIVPGGRNYFLASDSALSLDIPGLIERRGIQTRYVNKYYLDTVQLKERSALTLSGSAALSGRVNRDFTPVAVWYQMTWWMSMFRTTHALVLVIFIVVLVVMILTLNPVSAGLFAGGFTLASSEIILIVGVQVLCGYLFQAVGAIIMVFMLGLAAGSGARFSPRSPLRNYRRLQVLLGFVSLMIPFVIRLLNHPGSGDWLTGLVLASLAFSIAFIMGMEYRVALVLSGKTMQKTVPGNYSAEMFGSAAGAFAVTLFLIPAIGMINTGIFLALLNLAAAGSLYLVRKKA